jgi:acetyl esterase/lipase
MRFNYSLCSDAVGNAMKLWIIVLCVVVATGGGVARAGSWQPSAGHTQVPIWPGTVPDARPLAEPEVMTKVEEREFVAGKPWLYIERVSQPTMTVYSPPGMNTGVAVVVFPGGGYQGLAIDLEGTEVCDWLTAKGITCVVSKYRVPGNGRIPHSGAYPNSAEALEDAQRTLGLTRLHAAEWHIDPHKIGVLGFSAGGHLVAAVSTNYAKRLYPHVDAADQESCRPDFGVAIYPGHMMEHTSKRFELNPYVPVTGKTPPQFLLQNEDDPVDDVENSLVYYEALRKAAVPVEMHLYAQGGHGFGLRRTRLPVTEWAQLVETWLGTIGMISQ